MSKVPEDQNGSQPKLEGSPRESTLRRAYVSLIPKMSLNLNKTPNKSSRITSLREKLNDMSKQDHLVDKKTKGIINDITQRLVEAKDQESGPYSLLFELQTDPGTSKKDIAEKTSIRKLETEKITSLDPSNLKHIINSASRSTEKLPHVLHFDEKSFREFEYSCETECNFPVKKVFNTHSRSDLCLQLKSHARNMDSNLSPNENSSNRTNEENSLDDSLGILTPDQMDDICYLENAFSPTVEGLPTFCSNNISKPSPENGDTPSTDKTESNSAASTIQNDGFEENTKNKISQWPLNTELNKDYTHESQEETKRTSGLAAEEYKNNEKLRKTVEDVQIEEGDFLPSVNSSILEPRSSIIESIINVDMPLTKNKSPIDASRIDETPSPEDLPLDCSDINGEVSTYSQFSSSTLHDTDSKNDYTKSMETSKVSNSFITSITSITSLDGYQGDGEMSRPVSRGADHSIGLRDEVMEMDWHNVPVTRRADPMTDSDFFTESDADGLDEHMQRGDRRAQVIDGALYRGKNGNANPALIVNNRNDDSCMESSGVYTDFENQRASPVFLNVINDMSPDASTPSTKSECSQKTESTPVNEKSTYFSPLKDSLLESTMHSSKLEDEDVTPKNTFKRNSLNSEKDSNTQKSSSDNRNFTLKKYKMPKRDVPSKLKTMLNNKKTDDVQSPKTVKKIERANLSKISSAEKTKSYKDIKSKVDCSFPLQRSQTACGVTRMLSSKSSNSNTKPKSRHLRMRMELDSATGSGKSSLHSSQSDISSPGLIKQNNTRFPLLRNGKKRESAPPAAAPSTPARAPASPPTPVPQAKKNGVVQKLCSSPVTNRTRTSLAPPPSPRKTANNRAVTSEKKPNNLTKEPPRVTNAVGPRNKRVQAPQPTVRSPPAPLVPAAAALPAPTRGQAAALAHAAKGVEALGVLVQYLVFRLDAINSGSWRQETEKWRSIAARADRERQQRAQKDLDTITECLSKISELEGEVSSKEEANARLQAAHVEEVAGLANDIKGLKDTIESLKHEVAESRARLHAHSEIERTLRAQLEAARAENESYRLSEQSHDQLDNSLEQSLSKCDTFDDSYGNLDRSLSKSTSDAACDPVYCEIDCDLSSSFAARDEELSTDATELAAEVRSLRAVIDLKQAEMAALRDARSELIIERERRIAAEREARAARHAAEELKERAAARQRDVDILREDNRRFREIAARDRDHATKMAALNEQLIYKLRQRSQVANVRPSSGAWGRARACSSDSRSSSPAADSPPSPAASPPPTPAVKAVVEKHDSVSWVLEIEETPEEVAARSVLGRKSSFRSNSSSSSGGVKRRGGGSPSSPPAPASPAPAASKLFRPGDLDFPPPPPPSKNPPVRPSTSTTTASTEQNTI